MKDINTSLLAQTFNHLSSIFSTACPECYRLIQVEVNTLRRDILNITNSLTSVTGIVQLNQSSSFGTRLDSLTNSVSVLTANAQSSSTVESGLAAQLATLNFSLDSMQRILSQNVSGGVNETDANMRIINGTRNQIIRLQSEISQLLWASNYVLQRDVVGKVNATGDIRNSLDSLNRNMSSLWRQYSTRLTQTGASLNETLVLSGNAVSSTAAGVSRSNESLGIVNSSRLLLQQHRDTLVSIQASFISIQNNLSAALDNITRLSSQANEALRNANAINATPSGPFFELRARYESLQTSLVSLNRTLLSADDTYSTLLRNLTALQASSSSFGRSLNQSADELRLLLAQARNSETVATNAVNSANNVLLEAENMLRIMQNFNTTSQNAERMAEVSLRSTSEVSYDEPLSIKCCTTLIERNSFSMS